RLAAAEREDPFAFGRVRLLAATRRRLTLRRLARGGFARAALRLRHRLARSGFRGHWHVDLSHGKRPLSAKTILCAPLRLRATLSCSRDTLFNARAKAKFQTLPSPISRACYE